MDCRCRNSHPRLRSALANRYFAWALLSLSIPGSLISAENGQPINAGPSNGTAQLALLSALKTVSLTQEAVRKLGGEKRFEVYAGNPVLSPGEFGTWDAGAIGSMTVVIADGVFHMYYEAWGAGNQSAGGSVDYSSLQIGHAVSIDGIHWKKDPSNPVLPKGIKDEWDAKGTWDPFVIYEDGVFKLWYGGGIHPRCDWGYAESKDGRHFVKRGQISELHHVEDDHLVHDTVVGRYYMYYWDRQHEPRGLFRAESKNETNFNFANAVPLTIANDTNHDMNKFTHVVREGDAWFMFYADFVRPSCLASITRLASSADGVRWKSVNRNLFEGHDADVVRVDDSLYLAYYGPRGHFDQLGSNVRLAIYRGKLSDLSGNSN